MIISRTPFRISFFGGGTDYPAYFRRRGGTVLATTIDKYCYLTCRYLPPFFEHRIRVVYSRVENCQTIDEIGHPAVREVLRHMGFARGTEIHHDGDLPARSGMGSSSAFTVGLLHALNALRGRMPSKRELAEESIYIEQERLRETVGCQDQVCAAYGGFNHITFFPNGEFTVRPLALSPDRFRELNAHLMLFYTGIARTASAVARTYVADLERLAPQLEGMKALVERSIAVLQGQGDIAEFGRLLGEAWRAKAGLSACISSSQIDAIYARACAHGALGGKLMGAGGGGFMLLFVPPPLQARVREALRGLICVPFAFEFAGSQIIFLDPERQYQVEEELRDRTAPRVFSDLNAVPREEVR